MLSIKLFFFVHCAVFIGVNGYSISDHLKSLDDYQKKEGYKEDSDEIVGGHEVDITQYPHQVSVISMDYHPTKTFCGGSIISEQFVLSAAHCVAHNQNPDEYKIRAGSKYNGQGGRLYEINSITVHPDYVKIDFVVDYDAALLRTRERIAINGQTTRIVQLASSDNLEQGTLVTVTGWGVTKTDSHVLNAVSLAVVDRAKCNILWNEFKQNITDRMLCAGDQLGKSACFGDSGGPLVTETNVTLYGIVSFGTLDCNGSRPNVYTNVAAVRDWIKQVAGV